ncbi:hypothetical protein [Streptomyces sp. NPDC002054]|uniref:hypothetical protein n=1 Tax=Streptomyces sp. NPDC002054 TaxID=3154663 RepID=UPI00331F5463
MTMSEVSGGGSADVGNAGPFLAAAAERLGLRLHGATHREVHAGYTPWLVRALAGVCFTDLTDPDRALADMEAGRSPAPI